jgi:hypothetical protein
MVPFRSRRLRLERATAEDVEALRAILNREGMVVGTSTDLVGDGVLRLRW